MFLQITTIKNSVIIKIFIFIYIKIKKDIDEYLKITTTKKIVCKQFDMTFECDRRYDETTSGDLVQGNSAKEISHR